MVFEIASEFCALFLRESLKTFATYTPNKVSDGGVVENGIINNEKAEIAKGDVV